MEREDGLADPHSRAIREPKDILGIVFPPREYFNSFDILLLPDLNILSSGRGDGIPLRGRLGIGGWH
jgi:hypothetical protein